MDNPYAWAGHVVSILTWLGTILGLLPAVAATVAIIWYAIEIWESRTVRAWVAKRHERKIMRLNARLAALQLRSSAEAASLELKSAAQAAAQTLTKEAKQAVKAGNAQVPPV